MRALLLLLLLAITCRAQVAVGVEESAVDEATAGGSNADDKATASASSPQAIADDDDLIISEEVPVSSSSDTVNESPVADVIESSSSNAADAAAKSQSTSSSTSTSDTSSTATTAATTVDDELPAASQDDQSSASSVSAATSSNQNETSAEPVQVGPFIDLLGPHLLSLEMVDPTHAQLVPHYTNEALRNKKVIGLYFSADWCGPCRKFTPELVSFYNKMNDRRGRKDEFEIVWVSRCRDVNSYGQYFTQMNWLALPPEEAMGERGRMLGERYKVKGIPSLVLLDEVGSVITLDARNKIPADKAGIGFPWRNPIANLYITLVPRSLRLMVKSQVGLIKGKLFQRVKQVLGLQPR